MGLYKEITELKNDIAEREAQLNIDKARLNKMESQFNSEAEEFGKTLEKEAAAYEKQVLSGREYRDGEYSGDLKIALSKVIYRYLIKQETTYCYTAATPSIAGYCERVSRDSKISKLDPRLKQIQSAIVGDGVLIEISDKAIYKKKFLPIVIYFVKYRKYSPDDAIEAAKDIMEGRISYKIDDVDKYLYELELIEREKTESSAESSEEPKTDRSD